MSTGLALIYPISDTSEIEGIPYFSLPHQSSHMSCRQVDDSQSESCVFPFELGIDGFAGVQPDGLDIGFYLTVLGDQTIAAGWSQGGVIELVEHLILAFFKQGTNTGMVLIGRLRAGIAGRAQDDICRILVFHGDKLTHSWTNTSYFLPKA